MVIFGDISQFLAHPVVGKYKLFKNRCWGENKDFVEGKVWVLYLVLFLDLFFCIFLLLIIMCSISSPVSSPWPVFPQVRTMPHWRSRPSCLRESVVTTCLSFRAIGRSCLLAMISSGVSLSCSWKARVLWSSEYRILLYTIIQPAQLGQ